jgi:hypothetical protein
MGFLFTRRKGTGIEIFRKKYEEKPITDLTFEEAKLLYIRFLKETDSNVKINN